MSFQPGTSDVVTSPHSGLVRRHWADAAEFLLTGVLQHVRDPEAPLALGEAPVHAVDLELLARTFMLAAPLVRVRPDASAADHRVADYFRAKLVQALDDRSKLFVGHFDDVVRQRGKTVLGHTVEGAAIAVGLWTAGDAFWNAFDPATRARIVTWLHRVAHARTNTHNWRWFNVLMASFADLHGMPADHAVLTDHLHNLMAYYAGDGWYRDGAQFDFYSAWAFQFYGPIWCRMWGYAHMPEVAAIVERRHLDLQRTYPLMFGRDGRSPLWGRSATYRCAAAAPLAAAFLLNRTDLDPGQARRIASGNLMQFIGRDDVLEHGVLTLGYYGTFAPVVQGYSRRASSYWMAKLFIALALDADSSFWTAKENESAWAFAGQRTVSLPGPGLTITAHGCTGASELRPGKVRKDASDLVYTRLAYNTAFPAEEDHPQGATAATYAVRQAAGPESFLPTTGLRYAGMRGGVLYRQADVPGWMARVDLADIPIDGGVLRVDRLALPYACEVRLGHYALPQVGGAAEVAHRVVNGRAAIVVAGRDGRSVALVAYHGWDGVAVEPHAGLHPEGVSTVLPYAHLTRAGDHEGMRLVITLMLHRTGGSALADADLDPIADLQVAPWSPGGSPWHVRVTLRSGERYEVDFAEISGAAAN